VWARVRSLIRAACAGRRLLRHRRQLQTRQSDICPSRGNNTADAGRFCGCFSAALLPRRRRRGPGAFSLASFSRTTSRRLFVRRRHRNAEYCTAYTANQRTAMPARLIPRQDTSWRARAPCSPREPPPRRFGIPSPKSRGDWFAVWLVRRPCLDPPPPPQARPRPLLRRSLRAGELAS
jgi:hypothetical protein